MANIGESIKTQLKKMAKETGVSVDFALKRYVHERLLGRLANSEYADKFCLKGGLLIPVFNNRDTFRPSTDVNLQSLTTDGSIEGFSTILKKLAEMKPMSEGGVLPYDDGLQFNLDDAVIQQEREGSLAGGKIKFTMGLSGSLIPVVLDVAYSNLPESCYSAGEYPSSMDKTKTVMPPSNILMYTPEAMCAEKMHAMVQFGMTNSRIRDYYDLYFLSTRVDMDTEKLATTLADIFDIHGSHVELNPVGLSDKFVALKEAEWSRYMSRSENSLPAPDFAETCKVIAEKMAPALELAQDIQIERKNNNAPAF